MNCVRIHVPTYVVLIFACKSIGPDQKATDLDDPMDWGKNCGVGTCNQLDFLPFVCSACRLEFCATHRFPDAHLCAEWSSKDKVRTVCSKCGGVLEPPKDSIDLEPSKLIELHQSSGCTLHKAAQNEWEGPPLYRCSFEKCCVEQRHGWSICPDCGLRFCLQHRHPGDHACTKPQEIASAASARREEIRKIISQNMASLPLSSTVKRAGPARKKPVNPAAELMKIRHKAKGDPKVSLEDRLYLVVYPPNDDAQDTGSTTPASQALFFRKTQKVGQLIDISATHFKIVNVNNNSRYLEKFLHVHRALDGVRLAPGETLEAVLQSGETVHLVRGS
ncbi:hypothetical protein BJ742DRAFT_560812 [Cladochytrium replicatum]|nr:hypothetical protein BJ742DRAFT_560812 [Cladochytrium replicatum]